jgi:hypothetical protein
MFIDLGSTDHVYRPGEYTLYIMRCFIDLQIEYVQTVFIYLWSTH